MPWPLGGAPAPDHGLGRATPAGPGPPSTSAGPDPERALAENAAAMLGSARRVSLCEDDAHDAVQAAAERFLKHRERVDPETVTGWLVTVARNEALRVRERRIRTGAIDDDDRRLVHGGDGPDDLAVREEEVALAREALARLKPQERLALWMQAEGRSYDEIAEELSWTRTKVNRSITEGRASLRKSLAGIATGEGCAIAGPRIDRLAAGGASAEDLRELRPHLRRCAGCRGRLRRARGARWGVMPPLLVAWLPWAGRGGTVAPPAGRGRLTEAVAERLASVLPATSGAVGEAGLALTTGLAVVALGAGVVTGGVSATDDDREARETERRAPGRTTTAAARRSTAPAAAVLTTAGTTLRTTAASWSAARRRAEEAA
ncbi:sigma-70 family RNA polymerase sigma factor, partial [Patulibacter sp. NPDC049589]|uniref:RNA polymerase sigma factor n=1 Tax=Patulibacter sp. NPDC049589 TaxID=3154731 RepID=UPI00343D26EC